MFQDIKNSKYLSVGRFRFNQFQIIIELVQEQYVGRLVNWVQSVSEEDKKVSRSVVAIGVGSQDFENCGGLERREAFQETKEKR